MAPKAYAFISNAAMCTYITCWFSQYCYQVSLLDLYNIEITDYTTYLALTISGASLFILSFLIGLLRVCMKANALFWAQLITLVFGMTLVTVGMVYGQESYDLFKSIDYTFNTPAAEFCAICGIFFQGMLNSYEHDLEEETSDK